MARIRKIEIENFRGIQKLEWVPQPGVNCLIGPGDSGKSTVLEAIDWCLGARRTVSVTDADFYQLNTDNSIRIEIVIGDLHNGLKDLENYGLYLRGYSQDGRIEDEPAADLENVLSVRLLIREDLDPNWNLVSERAEVQGLSRNLSWKDRIRIAPIRIGSYAHRHLGWQKGSILDHLSNEKVDASSQLAKAVRGARAGFGNSADEQLEEILSFIADKAHALGVPVGNEVHAMLDVHSISFSSGIISLHNSDGIPLRNLGLGSSRLLVAGLQSKAAKSASIALVDEVEMGLEPHRITKFLTALGSKSEKTDFQVFMTTHSPAVLRELAARQLYVVRTRDIHDITPAGDGDNIQGTLRSAPEAFLGKSVLVCEGATEVGLIRGIDIYREEKGLLTFNAAGGVCVNAGGVSKIYQKAKPFSRLGYSTATLRDDDEQPKKADEHSFESSQGTVFKWSDGRAFEDELFICVSDYAVRELCKLAMEIHGADKVPHHLASECGSSIDIDTWLEDINGNKRIKIAKAAKSGKWFKSISHMEQAARDIVAPDLPNARETLRSIVIDIYDWVGIEWEI